MFEPLKLHLPLFTRFALLDRYVIGEMVLPFLFGVVAFTSVGTAIGSLFELVRLVGDKGMPILAALNLYFLQAPRVIVLTFPMSVLLATLMAYNRMSGDSEITAMRSCGVSPYRLIVPAVIFSLAISGLTFLFNEQVVPQANAQAEIALSKVLGEHRRIRNANILYQEFGDRGAADGGQASREGDRSDGLNRMFYARRFDGERMQGITVLDFSETNRRQIVVAQNGVWQPEAETWRFTQGTTYILNEDGTYKDIQPFDVEIMDLPRTPLDLGFTRGSDEMTIRELQDFIKIQEQSGKPQRVQSLLVDLQLKFAVPFACVAFALVGGPLGMRLQRTGGALGFGLSMIMIFGYYATLSISQGLGQAGTISPLVAAWLPNSLGLAVGAILMVRVAKV